MSVLGFAALLPWAVSGKSAMEKHGFVSAEKYCTYVAYLNGQQYVGHGNSCAEAKLDLYKQLCEAGWDNPNCQYVD